MENDSMTNPPPSFSEPCELVRTTCRKWMEGEGEIRDDGEDWKGTVIDSSGNAVSGRRSVRLRRDRLPALAQEVLSSAQESAIRSSNSSSGNANSNDIYPSTSSSTAESWIEWDSEGWHYSGRGFTGSASQRAERVALYLLALDAINFCFWPYPEELEEKAEGQNKNNPLEYEHLAVALKGLAEADHTIVRDDHERGGIESDSYALAPHNLSQMTPTKMKMLLQPYLDESKYPIPNIEKRSSLWKEVGEGLIREYNGSAMELLRRANKDAPSLVELVATSFPGFRDQVYLSSSSSMSGRNERIVFLKRAQIFVGDINSALNLQLGGMERLTTFADYRVPQILRHWEILEYAPTLAHNVDRQIELLAGSSEEISIRAATVVAVEELVKFLNKEIGWSATISGAQTSSDMQRFTDVNVDWYLWQVGERMHQEGLMKPFHKVRTHFY